jgi:hypothetical protein
VTVRLPPGAFIDDAATAALLRNPTTFRAASDTWHGMFEAMGEDISLPSMLMGHQLTIFGRRLDEVDGSTTLHEELRPSLAPDVQKRRDLGMVASARCLMSPSEIAQSIGFDDAAALFDAIPGLTGGRSGRAAIAALRGVRELFDLIRRWRTANEISRELNLDRSFVFALWRQEGALVVAPPASTYAAGPLIHTAERTCRSPLFFNDADGRRDGFSLTVGSATPALGGAASGPTHEAALNLFMLPAALLAAGEDQIIKPLLHEEDELWVLLKAAAAQRTPLLRMETWSPAIWRPLAAAFPTTTKASLAAGGIPGLARRIFEVMAGLGSVHLEGDLYGRPPAPLVRAAAPANESDLSNGTMLFLLAMQERLLGLLAAHPGDQTGAIVSLLAPDEPDDTRRVVFLLCELVKARRKASTFLALRDRSPITNERPLSDQMAYLRFHLGDALFGKFLVRAGGQLRRLSRAGAGLPQDSAVRRAIDGVSDLQGFHEENQAIGRIFNAMNPLRNAAAVAQQDTVWRHIGLLELLRRGPRGVPAWLPAAPTPPDLDNAAHGAMQLFDIIERHNALPAIEAVLFKSPFELIRRMASDGVLPIVGEQAALSPIAKAQSFALLRATFAAAFDRAEMPDKAPALNPQP